jgi:hypothetical protein
MNRNLTTILVSEPKGALVHEVEPLKRSYLVKLRFHEAVYCAFGIFPVGQ